MIDGVLLGFAYGAGAASFFSPCSVGLLPAYIGYYLGTDEEKGHSSRAATTPSDPVEGERELVVHERADVETSSVAGGVFHGAGLGLVASLGFFALFLTVGLVVSGLGTAFLAPYMIWISRAVGAAILVLGLFVLSGRTLSISPRVTMKPQKSFASLFTFGVMYGFASLGCTLPIFLSVVLGSFSASSPLVGVSALVAYAAGMATFMVIVSMLLGASRESAKQFLSRVVPHIKVVSGLIMVGAGAYILYYYFQVVA